MQLKWTALFFICVSLFYRCGEAPNINASNPKSDDFNALSPEELALKHNELMTSYNSAATLSAQNTSELSYLENVNKKLCQRLSVLKSQCVVAARIVQDTKLDTLACADKDTQQPQKKFVVKITSSEMASQSTKFILVADNLYQSAEFGQGESSVTFSSLYHSGSNMPPRFVDLNQLKIVVTKGVLPSLNSLSFSFFVDDTQLLTQNDLILTDASTLQVNLKALDSLKSSDACRVSPNELTSISSHVDRQSPIVPKLSDAHNVTTNPPQTASVWRSLVTELSTKLKTLKDDEKQLNLQVTFERDRQGKLNKELLGESALGCFAFQKINKLELKIKGMHLEDGPMFETKAAQNTEGSPASIVFDFGSQMQISHSDEERNSIFYDSGRILDTSFQARKIGEIEHISLTKSGVDFKNAQTCSQFLLFFKVCRYQNWETKRYRLDDLTVLVNDLVLYQKNSIQFIFEKNSLVWDDRNIAMNQSYLDLMARTDCPTGTLEN